MRAIAIVYSLFGMALAIGGGCSSSSHSSTSSGGDAGVDASSDASVVTETGGDAGAGFPFAPSNFQPNDAPSSPVVDVDLKGSSCIFDSNTGAWTCDDESISVPITEAMQPNGASVALAFVGSLKVEAGVKMTVSGSQGVIFFSLGDVDIEGAIEVSASGSVGGPGAYQNGGPGEAPNVDLTTAMSGGGASFCGVGGAGVSGAAGSAYGMNTLIPLTGGSSGAGHAATGYGGGAIQITSMQSLTIGASAGIDAHGGGGALGGGGGGSGGSILLEGVTVSIAGTLAANGGGGGDKTAAGSDGALGSAAAKGGGTNGGTGGSDATANGQPGIAATGDNGGGGGGTGRIRINTMNGMLTMSSSAVISPSLATACATVGTVSPASAIQLSP